MKTIRVKDNPGLAMDVNTGAIININSNEMNYARERKKQKNKEKERIDRIETELNDIKYLLTKLLEQTNDY